MSGLVLDPAKLYAELKRGSNVVLRVFPGKTIPHWAVVGRAIIEIPEGVAVEPGYVYNGTTFAPPPGSSFAEKKLRALREIDIKAEHVRLRYITPGSGQAGTYLIKERQAEEFKAAGYAGAPPSMVQAEMDATGVDAITATETILAERDFWLAKGAAIERVRRSGKVAINAVSDGDEIALDNVFTTTMEALDAL